MYPYRLRPWTVADATSLSKYGNDDGIAGFMTDAFPHPYTIEAAERFINFAMQHSPTRIFALEVEGEAAGGIGLHPQEDVHRRNAELGYWLGRPFWGKGIITDAIRQMVTYGFENLAIDRIFARPFGNNTASQRVLEKAGFNLEARLQGTIYKNGEYLDELFYAIRRIN